MKNNDNKITTNNNINDNRLLNIQNPIVDYKKHSSYLLFISSLKSKYTKIKYDECLKKYLKYSCNTNISSLSDILAKDSKIIENEIIQQLIEMKEENLSFSTMSVYIAALYHFFSINDITLNRKKLSKFVGEQENKYEYRGYTREEISKLLSLCDERGKVIVLLMASTGIRVGALPELKLKHLKRCKIDDNNHIYQIQIYASSKKYSYITFCTPECAQAIDNYLEYKKRIDKSIHFNQEKNQWISADPNTLLITRLFDTENVPYCSANFEKLSKQPMDVMGIRAYIVSRLKKLNLRQSWMDKDNQKHMGTHKNELHPCHSFRIFAVTNMQRSKVDKTIREKLIGHSIGLDAVYFKPLEEELLSEYHKAIDSLTIDNTNILKKQLEQYKQKSEDLDELSQKLNKKYENDIKVLEEKMKNTFQQILLKIDVEKVIQRKIK